MRNKSQVISYKSQVMRRCHHQVKPKNLIFPVELILNKMRGLTKSEEWRPDPYWGKFVACGLLLVVCLLLPLVSVYANNVSVTNVSISGIDSTYPIVEFDISWDNSWRFGAYRDAAWVFVKYSVDNEAPYKHLTISSVDLGSSTGTEVTATRSSDKKGIFIHRSQDGSGSVSSQKIRIKWEKTTDNLNVSADKIEVKVFALEMVYIPEGSFYLGDSDNSETNSFFRADGSYTEGEALGPYPVTSEDAITVGTADGNLYYDADNDNSGDQLGPIPVDFPKGYQAFYIMKYEIAQKQYIDFLNSLSRSQQDARVASDISAGNTRPVDSKVFVMTNTDEPQDRNGIRCPIYFEPTEPVYFYSDLNNNDLFNEADDGEWIACNYLSVMDVAAYADWAALRPMTELEFEKACRGTKQVVDNEYAWGNSTLEAATSSLIGAGTKDETANQGNLNYSSCSPNGPYRVGIYAESSSDREDAGASFYGAMELSGNLWERPVTVGNSTGRSFTGTHGDGSLSSSGYADNSDWPGYSSGTVSGATGSGFRGGTWSYSSSLSRVSDRSYAAHVITSRYTFSGGRAVRTSP